MRGAELLDLLKYGRANGHFRELDGILWNRRPATSVLNYPIYPVDHMGKPETFDVPAPPGPRFSRETVRNLLGSTLRAFNRRPR